MDKKDIKSFSSKELEKLMEQLTSKSFMESKFFNGYTRS